MELWLLGPVELWNVGREIPLGRPRQRCVLAVLAVSAGRPVGMDQLLARVWGERLPGDARGVMYTYVSRLRRALEQAGAGDGRRVLRRGGGGYLLDVDPDVVDLHRSRRLAAEARALDEEGSAERAVELWEEAAGLWRGVPLAGLAGEWAEATRAGLDQERLTILAGGFAARLRLGGHAAVIGPLSDLVAEHPLDESLAGLLMLSLHRCGRQADALEAYAGLRRRLIEEIGDEPGERLRRLHEQILRRDPTVDHDGVRLERVVDGAEPAAASGRGHGGSVRPAQLPPDVNGFTGRARDLARLDALVPNDDGGGGPAAVVISAVEGIPGVGKTALAVHWAHRVSARFPDGQLYLNMRGYAQQQPLPPIEALARLLRTLGVPAERVPVDVDEAAALYRSLLAGKRMLVVLDNAASAVQVRPLLPGGGGSVVLVTSRDQLGGLVASDGAHRITLDVLPAPDAAALVARIVGTERAGPETQAVAELAELCGRLPLALRIAAANLAARPRQSIADYVARLRGEDRLTALAVAGDPHSAVRVSFDLSYTRLPPAARRMFRLLALVPGPDVTADAAAALADLGVGAAGGLLEQLAHAHLIDEHAAGRYTCHDLLRRYSADLAASEEAPADRAAARERLYDFYLTGADAAAQTLYPQMVRLPIERQDGHTAPTRLADHQRALAWLDEELPCLVAAVKHASGHGPLPIAWLLADALRGYFWLRRYAVDWLAVAEAALTAALADDDRAGQAFAWLSLADANHTRGSRQQALDLYQRARRAGQHLEDSELAFAALTNMGVLYLEAGRLGEAAECFEQVLAFDRQVGILVGEAVQLGNLGCVYRQMGQLQRAADLHTEAMTISRDVGILQMTAAELGQLAESYHQLGRLDQARDLLSQALSMHRTVGERADETQAQLYLAAIQRDSGQPAINPAQDALAQARDIADSPVEANALNTLASIHHRLGQQHQAIDYHKQALQIASGSELGHPRAEALIGLAAAHLHLDDHKQAHRFLEQADTIIKEAGFRLLEAQALTVLAELHLAEGDPARAARVCERALATHHETGCRLGQARTHLLLNRACQRIGDTGAAHAHRREAHTLYTDIGIPHESDNGPNHTAAK